MRCDREFDSTKLYEESKEKKKQKMIPRKLLRVECSLQELVGKIKHHSLIKKKKRRAVHIVVLLFLFAIRTALGDRWATRAHTKHQMRSSRGVTILQLLIAASQQRTYHPQSTRSTTTHNRSSSVTSSLPSSSSFVNDAVDDDLMGDWQQVSNLTDRVNLAASPNVSPSTLSHQQDRHADETFRADSNSEMEIDEEDVTQSPFDSDVERQSEDLMENSDELDHLSAKQVERRNYAPRVSAQQRIVKSGLALPSGLLPYSVVLTDNTKKVVSCVGPLGWKPYELF